MKKTKKPKKCDCCMEEGELHWSKEEDMWMCDGCEDDLYEKRCMDDYWEQESFKAMLEEEEECYEDEDED